VIPVVILGVLLGTVALGAAPAAAHNRLVSSSPADSSTLKAPPRQVRLVFAENVTAIGAVVRVVGSTGDVSTGAVSVRGRTVTQSLLAGLAPDTYFVGWRVSSADGHPVSGEFRFTLPRSAAEPHVTPPAPGRGTTPGGTTAAGAEPSATVTSTTGPSATSTDASGTAAGPDAPALPDGLPPAVLAVGAVLSALAVGATGYALWRRFGPPGS